MMMMMTMMMMTMMMMTMLMLRSHWAAVRRGTEHQPVIDHPWEGQCHNTAINIRHVIIESGCRIIIIVIVIIITIIIIIIIEWPLGH